MKQDERDMGHTVPEAEGDHPAVDAADPITIDELEAANPLLSATESTVPTISDLETDVI